MRRAQAENAPPRLINYHGPSPPARQRWGVRRVAALLVGTLSLLACIAVCAGYLWLGRRQ